MQKSELATTDLKECCYKRPSTADVEIQTDIQCYCNRVDTSVAELVELATFTIGAQTDCSQTNQMILWIVHIYIYIYP